MLALLGLPLRVLRRFHADRCAQAAASLSFNSLLGLVPLIAVGLALLPYLPFAEGIRGALEKFLLANLLPDKAGAIIARYVSQFAHQARQLTWVGGIALVATALMQMLTIEHAFNAIWKVRKERPLLQRLGRHLLALLLGPLLFGGSLAATGYIAGVSLGVVAEGWRLNTLFASVAPLVFMSAIFALLYLALPNRQVSKWHALAGGVCATLGFTVMHRLFSIYVANIPSYTVIYGAFAAVPMFLIWLYLSWSVVLVGALIVAELPAAGRPATAPRRAARRS